MVNTVFTQQLQLSVDNFSFHVYLLDFESGSQQELLVLLSDLDVVDFVLVEDHQGEGLIGQLPGAVPHQVGPVLNTDTETDVRGEMRIQNVLI